MIKTKNLKFSYDQSAALSFPDWTVEKTEPALLLGQSGSGKTTLLHLLGGLLKPDSGNIFIEETDIGSISGSQLDHFRGKHIGFIFQKPHLIQSLNVLDNLLLAQHLAGVKQDRSRCTAVLDELGISNKAKSKVFELSEGQAQRVSIARAVVNHPDLLLADEPTSALDDEHCERVINTLIELADSNQATLLIATHDQRLKDVVKTHLNLSAS